MKADKLWCFVYPKTGNKIREAVINKYFQLEINWFEDICSALTRRCPKHRGGKYFNTPNFGTEIKARAYNEPLCVLIGLALRSAILYHLFFFLKKLLYDKEV